MLREGYSFLDDAVEEYCLGSLSVTVVGRDGKETQLTAPPSLGSSCKEQQPPPAELKSRVEELQAEITRVSPALRPRLCPPQHPHPSRLPQLMG